MSDQAFSVENFEHCKEPHVLKYLDSMSMFVSAVVAADGSIYVVVEGSQDKQKAAFARNSLVGLSAEVQKRLSLKVEPKRARISFAEYNRLKANSLEVGSGPAQKEADVIEKSGSPAYLLDMFIQEAVRIKASDIYIDVREFEKKCHISYKVYGLITRAHVLGLDAGKAVLRIMWKLSLDSDWEPGNFCKVAFSRYIEQQGVKTEYRFRANSADEEKRGNSIACRIRDPKELIPIESAGYTKQQAKYIYQMLKAPGGLIVFSGPTDSGKSTTLTTLLSGLPKNKRIIEVASPIEVYADHCVHIPLNAKSVSGSDRLEDIKASIVQQNPDYLILGEMHDERTSGMAMSMAQQGKLVLTTVHATDCSGVPSRLKDLGVDIRLLGYSTFFAGSVSQNLIPLLCQVCSTNEAPNNEEREHFEQVFKGHQLKYRNEAGCENCRSGVIGQTLVAEVFPMFLAPDEAYQAIADERYMDYKRIMFECALDIETKHQMAATKILQGLVDPVAVEAKIGMFDENKVWVHNRKIEVVRS